MEIPFIPPQAQLEVSGSQIFYQPHKSLKASHLESYSLPFSSLVHFSLWPVLCSY